TCRSFATISSGLYRFLAIAVLLDVKDIPQVGPLQWGWIKGGSCATFWVIIVITQLIGILSENHYVFAAAFGIMFILPLILRLSPRLKPLAAASSSLRWACSC